MSAPASAASTAAVDVAAPAVALRGVSVAYGDTVALADCSFEVRRGETLALLGPSGSGKSTALKAIAGFENVVGGTVEIGGRDVTGLSPAARGTGFVMQQYALFPHMSVRANVSFGLKAQKVARAQIKPRVDEVLRMVGMFGFADRLPRELSGGQQQRVAIARALAPSPSLLLLDEPLSALDTRLREEMLIELQQLRRDLPGIAIVHVTHDQAEALALADRIAIMRNSRLEAIDTADRLFHQPPSEFAATFLGGADILPARATAPVVAGGVGTFEHGGLHLRAVSATALAGDKHVALAVRPWAWELSEQPRDNAVQVLVHDSQWRGAVRHVRARVAATDQFIGVDVPVLDAAPESGRQMWAHVAPEHVHVVPAEKSA
ncbi:ABC transporter ATP-binding protein [Gordonia alkaliphila]|uniref:ABC transporter ATP-binding protein n=1 Tax=Gordonia alkaliphila TaxID=1053547 RepID=UPI001FF50597|nr:ABC transporter ATP-binding protein [Gordonia alkaliphila]MCK0440641.1 ABC transporter ATP-binding protein [Gordonia alkaliphila]